MARKSGLGKGLDALIPGGEPVPSESSTILIPVERILPNPRQPRANFPAEELAELVQSIREHGILQPLLVSLAGSGNEYTLIAGERRLRAAKEAGLSFVPASIRQVTPEEQLALALIENLQRTDLNPLEAAEAYRQLIEDFQLSQEAVAAQVGKSRVAIANTLRLLRLPPEVQQGLREGKITEGHARALLGLPTSQAQLAAYQTVIRQELSVRKTEELVRMLTGSRPSRLPRPAAPPEILAIEERLRSSLGTKVNLRHGKKGGRIIIHYFSDEELNTLIDHLTNP